MITAPGARRVTVGFSAPGLGVPERTVVATAVHGGFRVSGLYASMTGDWRVRVDTGDARAVFHLPVSTTPPEPGSAPTPAIRTSVWLWGFAELALVIAALAGAALASRMVTRRRAARRVDVTTWDHGPEAVAIRVRAAMCRSAGAPIRTRAWGAPCGRDA